MLGNNKCCDRKEYIAGKEDKECWKVKVLKFYMGWAEMVSMRRWHIHEHLAEVRKLAIDISEGRVSKRKKEQVHILWGRSIFKSMK